MKKTSYLLFRSLTILLLGIISLAAAYPAEASISHQGQTADTSGILDPENRPLWRVGIIKYTNGQLASDPDGADVPLIKPGDWVEWTYMVTNTGINPIPRELLSVTDDQPGVTPVFDREVSGNGDNNLDLGEVWLYIATGVAVNLLAPPAGVTTVPGVCTGDGARPPSTAYVNRGTVTIPEATASADSSYCNPPAPSISILKRTNGQIASDPDGAGVPQIEPGDPVTWTYEVTNTGNVPVAKADVSVTDDQTGVTPVFDQELSGNGDEVFDPGEVWQYKATGVAADLLTPPDGLKTVPGVCTAKGAQPPRTAYVNQGTATIPGASDEADSSYCNPPAPSISILKRTNGQIASDPDGADVPQIEPGDPVTWTYEVTNTGNVPVAKADVSVTDDQTGVTPVFDQELSGNGDEVFDPGEVWQYKATGVAADLLTPPDGLKTVPGVCTANGAQPPRTAYVNQGTATIPGASDEADSSYCNPPAPAISILKRTNGQIASDPNGTDVPRIEPGDPVTWTYEVTNTGNVSVPKADLVVTDDQPGVTPVFDQEITGNGDESFDPGEVWQYKATGTAVDLSAPPEGVTTIPEVCTANGTKPPSTAYVNQGTASIPGAESTAESTYCSADLYQIYLPLLRSPGLTKWETSVGFEDLPLESGQNDYDYNDWLVDIDGTVTYDAEIGASGIRRLTFAFLPHSRGASFSHVFHMLFPANVFGSNGTAVLTTYDQNLNVVGNQTLPFNAASANDYVIFADTTTVFPGSIVNTIEGKANEPMAPRRTAVLTIDFTTPFPFDLSEFTLDHPHGLGLFFDPYLRVNETSTDIHAGDIRMLVIPETSYLWPEEGVRIDRAYPNVTINDGPPPTTSFPSLWWVNFNNCVYDGVVCTP